MQQNGWIFKNEHEKRGPVTESLYHLHYVKVKIRQDSSEVKEVRAAGQVRAMRREKERGSGGGGGVYYCTGYVRGILGVRIFLLWSGSCYIFTYWNIHWSVDIHNIFRYLSAKNASMKNFFLFVVDFVIHWNETAKGLHVFPIPIPPPISLSTHSL